MRRRNKTMRSPTTLTAAALVAAATLTTAHAAEVVKPNIGEPLRDAAVTRAPDGIYYLTGARASGTYDGSPDFMSNDGIKLWSSKDLVEWKDEGLAWNLHPNDLKGTASGWRSRHWYLPERPISRTYEAARGMTSPRLTFAGKHAFLTHSMSGYDVGVLRAAANNPASGYQITLKGQPGLPMWDANRSKLARGDGGGSVFRDADGSLHLVWGAGYLRPLTADGGEGGREVTHLFSAVAGYPNAEWCAQQFRPRNASLFLHQGQYILTWAAFTDEAGYKRDDSFYAVASKLVGPYSAPRLLIPGSGPVVLCDTGDKGLMASCSIGDEPVLVPLQFEGGVLAALAQPKLPAAARASKAGKLAMFDYAAAKPTGKWFEKNARTGGSRLTPLQDIPLADTSIVRGGDGAWYMTGTVASRKKSEVRSQKSETADFENNDGIHLWRSADMSTWEYAGKVWDIENDGGTWAKQFRIPGDNPNRTDFCRGATAPQLHFADGTFWIAYSMNGRGTGLLKSTTGKAEGPYEDLGRLTGMGGAPSLFAGADGTRHWLWDELLLAKIEGEKPAVTGPARSLLHALALYNEGIDYELTDLLDATGGFLFEAVEPKSKQKRVFLTFSAVTQSHGRANRETHIAWAPSLAGPWSWPVVMVRHGGQNSVFDGPEGKLFASFSGADPASALRDRPGIVPLEWGWQDMPRQTHYSYYTAAGPWDEMDALMPEQTWARDPWLTKEGEYFYYAPSPQKREPFTAGARVWRSKDLKDWELLPPLYTFEQMKAEPRWPAIKGKEDESWNKDPMAWEISLQKRKGNYWITTWMGGVEGKKFIGALLKSASGKPEGPYEFHVDLEGSDVQQVFEDDDGNVWAWYGAGELRKLKPDLSGLAEPREQRCIVIADASEGSNDCGGYIFKVGKRWFISLIESAGEYSSKYYWAEKFDGPYHKIGTLAHGGNSNIFDDGKGNWFLIADPCGPGSNYGNPFPNDPSFILPIHFTPDTNPPVIRHLHETPLVGEAVYEK